MSSRSASQAGEVAGGEKAASSLDELLTPPAVAHLLGVSPPTVYAALRRTNKGLSHLRTPGGQIRVRRREVLAYCHGNGIAVPEDLLAAPVVHVLHPDRRAGGRLCRLLDGVAEARQFSDPVDALVHLGAERPAMLLVSDRVGDDLVERICTALTRSDWLGYTTVIRLVPGKTIPWEGGALPVPLDVGESSGRSLAGLVAALLGVP